MCACEEGGEHARTHARRRDDGPAAHSTKRTALEHGASDHDLPGALVQRGLSKEKVGGQHGKDRRDEARRGKKASTQARKHARTQAALASERVKYYILHTR